MASSIVPYIRHIQDTNHDFPEGFCDIVTATIVYVHKVPGFKTCCGTVEHTWHFWLKYGGTNIDFTAHQFPSLIKHVTKLNGLSVIIGSDQQFAAMGYVIEDQVSCERELKAVAANSILGKVGECSEALCLMD